MNRMRHGLLEGSVRESCVSMRVGHARQALSPSVPPMTAPHILKAPLAMLASNCRTGRCRIALQAIKLHFCSVTGPAHLLDKDNSDCDREICRQDRESVCLSPWCGASGM